MYIKPLSLLFTSLSRKKTRSWKLEKVQTTPRLPIALGSTRGVAHIKGFFDKIKTNPLSSTNNFARTVLISFNFFISDLFWLSMSLLLNWIIMDIEHRYLTELPLGLTLGTTKIFKSVSWMTGWLSGSSSWSSSYEMT